MKTTQATTLQEVEDRFALLEGDAQATHEEADFLLLDALLIAGYGGIVSAFMEAKRKHQFDY